MPHRKQCRCDGLVCGLLHAHSTMITGSKSTVTPGTAHEGAVKLADDGEVCQSSIFADCRSSWEEIGYRWRRFSISYGETASPTLGPKQENYGGWFKSAKMLLPYNGVLTWDTSKIITLASCSKFQRC
uniref:Uncharacterized protein n=1 Tax=Coccidioides posadasii RMSCC 3488 TaxID=454284 RepID=A0A0J6FVK3_COCPO|nr:hypothetical protein CPAG_09468 [Coccidioides posadasii RMSCC 3488]